MKLFKKGHGPKADNRSTAPAVSAASQAPARPKVASSGTPPRRTPLDRELTSFFSHFQTKPAPSAHSPTASLAAPSTPLSSAKASQHADFLAALFKAGIRGAIRTAGHVEYAFDALPWNLRCQPKPVAIVNARDARDVATAVKVAAAYRIPVQPRSGGHSYGSYSLGGSSGALVVDLAALDSVVVDQKTWNATIGSGTRLGKVTKELHAQGKRAMAHGTCPNVGIGGHATIGGQGPLSRMWGLTLDQLLEVEVVLADGSITRASNTKNADLFFALRGAGASFGIITSFVFETHAAPTVVTHYEVQYSVGSAADLAKAFEKWQTFISSPIVLKDRAFNSVVAIAGSGVLIQGTRYGSRAELEASELQVHLRKFYGDVKVWEMDFLASVIHWATDELENLGGAVSLPLYVKNLVVRQAKPLTPVTLQAFFAYLHSHSTHGFLCYILADLEAGRISDFANNATAYAQRDALYTIAAYAVAPLPFPDDVIGFLDGLVDTVTTRQPDGNFGAYPGYVDPLLPKSKWPRQYWGENYPRLLKIKSKYDPGNVFSNPQSVGADLGAAR